MKSITPILIALLLIAGDMPTRAQPPDSLVGTWRLVSFSREIVATKEVVQAFGGHGAGFATYTADGRYMSPIIDSARKPPAQPMATDSEAISLYRTMSALAGSYRVEGDTIIYPP